MTQTPLNTKQKCNSIFTNDSLIQETNDEFLENNILFSSELIFLSPVNIKKEEITLDNFHYPDSREYSIEYDLKKKEDEKPTKTNTNDKKIINNKNKISLEKRYFSVPKGETKQKSNIGRKRKNDCIESEHTKYSDDNLRTRAKTLIMNCILKFLNEKIKSVYKGNIGNGLRKKELLSLNLMYKNNINIEYNKKFIYKTLGEIFSEDISTRYTIYSSNFNSELIKRLLNEEDEQKRVIFQKLFNIRFFQCIENFTGTNTYEELEGFLKFKEIRHSFKDEPEYLDKFELYLKNFKENIENKKGREKKLKPQKRAF